MEELAHQYAKNATLTTLWAAIATAIVIIGVLAKLFKDWKELVQALQRAAKGVGMLWKWIMRSAIWRRDLEKRLDRMEAKQEIIKAEVTYNGGGSTKDAVRRVENHVTELSDNVKETALILSTIAARLHISELHNNRMTFRIDEEGACIEINEIFLRKFGYAEKDVLGYGYENLVHEEDVMEMRGKWQRAIEQCSRFKDEQRIFNSNKEMFDCCVQAFPICQGDKLIEFVGFIEILKK